MRICFDLSLQKPPSESAFLSEQGVQAGAAGWARSAFGVTQLLRWLAWFSSEGLGPGVAGLCSQVAMVFLGDDSNDLLVRFHWEAPAAVGFGSPRHARALMAAQPCVPVVAGTSPGEETRRRCGIARRKY